MPKKSEAKKKETKKSPKKTSSSKSKAKKKTSAKPRHPRTKESGSRPKASGKSPAKKKAVAKEEGIQKLRIRVRAYEHKVLDASVKQIIDTALRYDAKIQGPTPLPTEKKKYTVNRAPFIFEDSREQFEMRVHKRLIDIIDPPAKVVEALSNISLPSGVNIDVKMV